jgi:hypothetical protein
MSVIVRTKRKRLKYSWVLLVLLDCGHIITTHPNKLFVPGKEMKCRFCKERQERA